MQARVLLPRTARGAVRSLSILLAIGARGADGVQRGPAATGPVEPASEPLYDAFRRRHWADEDAGRDHVGRAVRASLFQARSAEVAAHNARPGVSWKKAVNKFSDRTDSELRGMLGRVRGGGRPRGFSPSPAASVGSLLQVRHSGGGRAASVDWRDRLNTSRSFVHDQGSCGSCWAVAAVGALEMHAEALHGRTVRLSYEELVDCVPNPEKCGGEGGCKGATAELALQYVQEHGLSTADGYQGGYQSGGDGTCQATHTDGQKRAVSTGFEQLPANELEPLLEAVATTGPVVVSVDASGWASYAAGVFDGCPQNATINHAVLLVGFGTDNETGMDYWLIRNSWGDGWGEEGHIRLKRHQSDRGDAGHCGVDTAPLEGVGCPGGPPEMPVCGMCGVLSDSSYPTGVHVSRGPAAEPMGGGGGGDIISASLGGVESFGRAVSELLGGPR